MARQVKVVLTNLACVHRSSFARIPFASSRARKSSSSSLGWAAAVSGGGGGTLRVVSCAVTPAAGAKIARANAMTMGQVGRVIVRRTPWLFQGKSGAGFGLATSGADACRYIDLALLKTTAVRRLLKHRMPKRA